MRQAVAPPSAPQSPDAIEPKPVAPPKAEPKKVAAVAPKPKPVAPPKKPEPKFKPDEVAKLLDDKTGQAARIPPKPAPKQKSGDEAAEPADKFDLERHQPHHQQGHAAAQGRDRRGAATGRLAWRANGERGENVALAMGPARRSCMQDQYRHCWNFIGMAGQEKYVPEIHVQYAQDGAFDRRAEAFEPAVRSQSALARRQRPARGAALQSDAHPGAVPALLRPVERPDRPLRS